MMMTTEAASAAFESAADYLCWDHDRLDALLDTVRNRVYNAEWAYARRDYDEFARGLQRHIRLEEDILFPVFEQRAGARARTTAMRIEHTRIRGVLGSLRDALGRGDAAGFRGGLSVLLPLLRAHNENEEQILYPADADLPAAERAALVRRLQSE
jgi:iron-sulfur cluster repair protein YtfE (RIC family)